jgi:hypothetical protein
MDIQIYPSCFGGGWAVPNSSEGEHFLLEWFGEPPAPLEPLGGQAGYIIEPPDASELLSAARASGLSVSSGEIR